jgi:energy-coupling factor transporter ATP-binding protein EcfA2
MYNNLVNAFTTISSGWSFEIFAEPNNDVSLNFSFKNQAWRGASTCGHGLQDLLVLLFFALSEYKIVLLEEPENHLHPEMQRKLLAFLKEKTDKQYFITTHSNVFLDNSYVDRVFFTSFQDSIQVDDATSRASIPADLGYNVSDNLVSDLVILIEGPTDAPVIEEFLIKYDLKSRYNIKTWPLGGHIMNQLDLSVFSQSFKLIALIDSDPGSNGVRNKFVEIHKLERYAIENYFPLHVLRDVFSTQIPEDITEITPGQKLEDQVGLNVKNNNRKIARKMQLEDIKGTDLEQFFIRVKELCQS